MCNSVDISSCKKMLFNERMLIRGYDVTIHKGYATWLPNLTFDFSMVTQVFLGFWSF